MRFDWFRVALLLSEISRSSGSSAWYDARSTSYTASRMFIHDQGRKHEVCRQLKGLLYSQFKIIYIIQLIKLIYQIS